MIKQEIRIHDAESVKHFVFLVSQFSYDLDLRSGRHVVDGKSILGIFSLDLSKPVTMEVYADSCDDLLEVLKTYISET